MYILVSHTRLSNVYVVKLRHSGGLDPLMGVAHNRTCASALQTSRKKAPCRLQELIAVLGGIYSSSSTKSYKNQEEWIITIICYVSGIIKSAMITE